MPNFRGEPGLADARVADDRDQLAALLGLHTLPGLPDERDLALTADEERLVATLRRLVHAHEPVAGNPGSVVARNARSSCMFA